MTGTSSQKRILAALGRRPLYLLSVCSCQLRATGLGTGTWVGCLCGSQNVVNGFLVDGSVCLRTLPLLSSKADPNNTCRYPHMALPNSPQGWAGPIEIVPVLLIVRLSAKNRKVVSLVTQLGRTWSFQGLWPWLTSVHVLF